VIHLPRGVSATTGRISFGMTPYLIPILAALQDPEVEGLSICKSTQVGGTTLLIVAALWVASEDPWNVLVVMPGEDLAVGICEERFQPIVRESPHLARLLGETKREMTRQSIRLNGVNIDFAWATSPAMLSSRAVCVLIEDELDKWPMWSGKEADPVSLAEERTRTFVHRKILRTSTPTTDRRYIWPALLRGTNERYHIPCPHCGRFQVLIFGVAEEGTAGIKWPKEERDPDAIHAGRLAWYECESCHGKIKDLHKPAMLSAGRWLPRGQSIVSGEVVGPAPVSRRERSFHLWAGYSPFLTFSEIASKFLRSKGDRSLMMNFVNSWLAEPWRETAMSLEESHLLARVKDYQEGVVPRAGEILTAGVDVQLDHMWFAIRAWGPAERSWLVRAGTVFSWRELEVVLMETSYPSDQGKPRRVQRVLVDSGYRTEEVYGWTRKHAPVALPTKGQHQHGASKPTWIGKPKPGILLVNFSANFWKDKLARLIQTKDGDPGEWNLHRSVDLTYRQQMLSEQRVLEKRKGGHLLPTWQLVSESAPNHLWDCEVLNLVAADIEGVRYVESRPATSMASTPTRRREGIEWLEGDVMGGEERGSWLEG